MRLQHYINISALKDIWRPRNPSQTKAELQRRTKGLLKQGFSSHTLAQTLQKHETQPAWGRALDGVEHKDSSGSMKGTAVSKMASTAAIQQEIHALLQTRVA